MLLLHVNVIVKCVHVDMFKKILLRILTNIYIYIFLIACMIAFLIVLMEPQSLSLYILSGLVLETCTSELVVRTCAFEDCTSGVHGLGFCQDLYMWGLYSGIHDPWIHHALEISQQF